MTREEAIEQLKWYFEYDNGLSADKETVEAYKMAIKALEQEPTTKNDAVSRQAVLNTLDNMDSALDEDRTVETYKELLKECYKVLPSVTPQEPQESEEKE